MGLVLKLTGSKDNRVRSSCSRLHTLRACVQLLFALRLKEEGSKCESSWVVWERGDSPIDVEEKKEPLSAIKEMFKEDGVYEPYYDQYIYDAGEERGTHSLCGLDMKFFSVWRGAKAFIDHSDCGGAHSLGECVDITLLFNFIGKYFDELDEGIRGDLRLVEELYRTAVKRGEAVLFC